MTTRITETLDEAVEHAAALAVEGAQVAWIEHLHLNQIDSFYAVRIKIADNAAQSDVHIGKTRIITITGGRVDFCLAAARDRLRGNSFDAVFVREGGRDDLMPALRPLIACAPSGVIVVVADGGRS